MQRLVKNICFVSIPRQQVLAQLKRQKLAILGMIIVLIFVFCAILAPWIAPNDPYSITSEFEAAPNGQYLLGTDQVGRDVFSRLIYAARVSLVVGFGAVTISTLIGIILGAVSGYFGGIWDVLIMRLADIFMSFPLLILIMVITSIIGPGLTKIIIILGILGWPPVARLVRGSVLSAKQVDYVKAAIILGVPSSKILYKHILPNILSPIIVQGTFGIARAITMEAALSFLGLGVNPPIPSWGNMLTDAQSLTILTSLPWLWIPPGLMIVLIVVSVNFIGDGLRDALDPKNA